MLKKKHAKKTAAPGCSYQPKLQTNTKTPGPGSWLSFRLLPWPLPPPPDTALWSPPPWRHQAVTQIQASARWNKARTLALSSVMTTIMLATCQLPDPIHQLLYGNVEAAHLDLRLFQHGLFSFQPGWTKHHIHTDRLSIPMLLSTCHIAQIDFHR